MWSQICLSYGAEFSLELKFFSKFCRWRFRNKCNWCEFLPASIFGVPVSAPLEKGESHSSQPFLLPDWFKKIAGEALQRADQFTFLLVSRSTMLSPWVSRTDVTLLCLYFPHWQIATTFSVAGASRKYFFYAGKIKIKKILLSQNTTNSSNFHLVFIQWKSLSSQLKSLFSLIFTSVILFCVLKRPLL